MNLNNLIIKNINSLCTDKHDIPIKEALIESVNNYGVKYVDIYFIAEDVKTHLETKNESKNG